MIEADTLSCSDMDSDGSFGDFLSFLSTPADDDATKLSSKKEEASKSPSSGVPSKVGEDAKSSSISSNSRAKQQQRVSFSSDTDKALERAAAGHGDLEAGIQTPSTKPDPFLLKAFQDADTDGDGHLSREELNDLLHSLGLEMEDETNIDKWIGKIDEDGSGSIDCEEFLSIFNGLNQNSMNLDQLLLETFELYDVDGSGDIDQAELKTLMAQLGHDLSDEELTDMINKIDDDQSGQIDFEEFCQLFKGMKPTPRKMTSRRNSLVEFTGPPKKKQKQPFTAHGQLMRKDSVTGGTIFDDAKAFVNFTPIFRFVTWLYSERKMILLACAHFVATMVVWGHFALIKFQEQEGKVPEEAPRYWAKRIVPPLEFGSMHAILFQMALIPFTMSRYTIASLSTSKLNYYLPLNKALRIHIHLGYTMVSIVFLATIVFFTFFGLLCSEGDEAFCDKFTTEIMITGYCILGLLILMASTAYLRNTIPYELFYGVHFLFLAMYSLAIAHTLDVAQRSGKKDRSQTFKWFVAPLIYYMCDYAMMYFNQRFQARVTSFIAVKGHDGSRFVILKMKRPTLFVFKPGQYAFLRVGDIDRAWHPFSIASDPDSSEIEFYIEVFGDGSWTEKLFSKLKNDKRQKLDIDLLGPYGTALVKEESYTNIVAIGAGTGIVPCTSLLKQHVRKMLMMEPETYLAGLSENEKKSVKVLSAHEAKDGTLYHNLIASVKGCLSAKNKTDDVNSRYTRTSSLSSLASSGKQQGILATMMAVNVSSHGHGGAARIGLKLAIFAATKYMYERVILTLFTLYAVTTFGLGLSWTLTTAEISTAMINGLVVMTVILHVLFFLGSFFYWNGVSLQSYVDAAISVILPFADWAYISTFNNVGSLSTGQIITRALLNGYVTFRFYQKCLAPVSRHMKEEVEHLRLIWMVRGVKMARQIFPEINETYESLVAEWGEDYAREVLDITIHITEKNKKEAASFRAEIRRSALFKSRKVFFIRPKLGKVVEEHMLQLIESRPACSSTLLAFCGGPRLSHLLSEARSNVELLTAALGYSSHQLDYVSESYGGAKPKVSAAASEEEEEESQDLWELVKNETLTVVNTQRMKAVFDNSDDNDDDDMKGIATMKEYKSQREMVEHRRRQGSVLRYRSSRDFSTV